MDDENLQVSFLTPTLNRVDYLERVWRSLENQTYRNFEWIVADDGSTDGTDAKVRELAARSSFPVTLIQASERVGKARMDNEAIRRARGKFILWCDSDDYFLPHALERLLSTWNSIPENQRENFVGVTALCSDNLGVTPATPPVLDCSWNDLSERYEVVGDLVFFTRADALKSHLFPEVDFVVPESVLWTTIGNRKARICPEVLKVMEYKAPGCISFSGKMEYSRGRAHALAICERNLWQYPRSLRQRVWRTLTFLRYCIHGDIGPAKALRLWGSNSSRWLIALVSPLAWALALRDLGRGKVVKTHREFLSAMNRATITTRTLS